ncbi:hypothetical protein PABG_11652 [Paracoccidioides brasiliensis Pb03]|uniref:Uncharacterized protein n=2 Tax=Paracoccidioides brasiliensis TaxID=121759 RepID=C1G3E9_PARBD|nr:uncharacterized protein PADG_01465 [Paracoccidioides brasiliensis Pb18]EEH45315.2 hypothetical protein PADG_01465 [Paracoccidioides brasiliensis Pb18]KGY15351.1 hypothetical protein PABG_11652 [Paracoccidioides brasiliensis Pb03]ODH35409.1 hypothetical protein ACO22_02933 [Paracoccidioides brasiliensis]
MWVLFNGFGKFPLQDPQRRNGEGKGFTYTVAQFHPRDAVAQLSYEYEDDPVTPFETAPTN